MKYKADEIKWAIKKHEYGLSEYKNMKLEKEMELKFHNKEFITELNAAIKATEIAIECMKVELKRTNYWDCQSIIVSKNLFKDCASNSDTMEMNNKTYINKEQLIQELAIMPISPEMTGFAIKECIKVMIAKNIFNVEEIKIPEQPKEGDE